MKIKIGKVHEFELDNSGIYYSDAVNQWGYIREGNSIFRVVIDLSLGLRVVPKYMIIDSIDEIDEYEH